MEADLSSGDLARATGCTPRAIRFYEQQGLLFPAVVSDGGHRRYTREHLETLRLIAGLRELGLSLAEIRGALDLKTGCTTGAELAQRFQEVLVGHIAQAERRLERLRRVKGELEQALAAIRARLACAQACPCEVEGLAASQPLVRTIARGGLCGEEAGPRAPPAPGADPGGEFT